MSYKDDGHTKAQYGSDPAHCIECSDAAQEWVSWPCDRSKLVKAAVSMALHLRSMDECEELEKSYRQGYLDGLKKKKRVFRGLRGRKGLKTAKNP